MNKGFDIKDGKYMCSCVCGKIFFSDNKRDVVCTNCEKSSETKYKIQRLVTDGLWIDLNDLEYTDPGIALDICKNKRQNNVNHIFRVVKIITEVLPLP